MHSEKRKKMLVASSVTTHLEQMFNELKDDPALWNDWETYFTTYLGDESFRESWQQTQHQYSDDFRAYVNSRLD